LISSTICIPESRDA